MRMPRQIAYGEQAQKALTKGIDALAELARVTLGPKGHPVMIETGVRPLMGYDQGADVVREVDRLPGSFENLGVQLLRHVATKLNERCGDGTSGVIVLTQAIVREGMRNIAAGADVMALKRGIEEAVQVVVEKLKEDSIEVRTKERAAQVATSSAGDREIGMLVAEVVDRVGKDGVVTVEESQKLGLEVEYIEGLRLDRGYFSSHFITNPEKGEAVVEDPYILITDMKISSLSDILPALQLIHKAGSKNFVLIADEVSGEALATLVTNKLRGNLNCLAIKPPGFAERRRARLEDAAIFTGGEFISRELGRRLDLLRLQDFGRARKVIADAEWCTIIGGKGSPEKIKERIQQIRAEMEQAGSDFALDKLQERLARLANAVAIIKVGAITSAEAKEKKRRLESALAATLAAVEEGVVPGGGVALVNCATALQELMEKLEGDAATGVKVMMRALEEPLRVIVLNAGLDPSLVVDFVRRADRGMGYDARTGELGVNMVGRGIIDATKVVRNQVQHAVSMALTVLTTAALVTYAPGRQTPKAHA